MSEGVRCMWMRGGTSKGAFFVAQDLPTKMDQRDAFLLRVMGSPDPRQIDGMGGANPLTSKVAIVSKSGRDGVDLEYLFLQVAVDQPIVSDAQNCGNMLAGVGPFALERGLVPASEGVTSLRVFMRNTGKTALVDVQTPNGAVTYEGTAHIDGVPGTHAPVLITFEDVAGSSCGALLPTGRPSDEVDGVRVTLIDDGMPCVLLAATDFGLSGYESAAELEANASLKQRLERIRLSVGPMMNLGDVRDKTVPKMTLVAPPRAGGAICTRTFIPHRCHSAIGVLGAATVANACLLAGSVAASFANVGKGTEQTLAIEHPSGSMDVVAGLDANGQVVRTAILRTARKLFDGQVF